MIETEQILERAGNVTLFSSLSEAELHAVLLQCQIALYLEGRTVFREGALGDSLMVVLQGDISLRCAGDDGVTVEVATLGEGAVLGEMAVIDPAPRAATAVATSSTVLLIMQKDTLDQLIASDHPAATKVLQQLLRLLANRFRTMEDRIEELFASRLSLLDPASPQAAWSLAPGE
jgi:CRP/FNR family cyclic AMP-dependent transcriptional regulator